MLKLEINGTVRDSKNVTFTDNGTVTFNGDFNINANGRIRVLGNVRSSLPSFNPNTFRLDGLNATNWYASNGLRYANGSQNVVQPAAVIASVNPISVVVENTTTVSVSKSDGLSTAVPTTVVEGSNSQRVFGISIQAPSSTDLTLSNIKLANLGSTGLTSRVSLNLFADGWTGSMISSQNLQTDTTA